MLKQTIAVCLVAGLLLADVAVAAPIVMKVGHAQPEGSPRHESYLLFKSLVEKRSNQAIRVEVYPAGKLGDELEMVEMMKAGGIQGVRVGVFDYVAPELALYTMPFLFKDLKSFQKITRGPIGERIAKSAEKNGIAILATGDAGGFRQITNNRHPILKPDDLKDLKIRVPPVEANSKTIEAFGGNPVRVPYGDVYLALKSGAADGQENPPVNIDAMKFQEVQKYMTIWDCQFHPDPFAVSLKWYTALLPYHQKIVKEAAVESEALMDKLVGEANQKAMLNIRKTLKVDVLSPTQRKAFMDKAKQVDEYFVRKGVFTQRDIDDLRTAAR